MVMSVLWERLERHTTAVYNRSILVANGTSIYTTVRLVQRMRGATISHGLPSQRRYYIATTLSRNNTPNCSIFNLVLVFLARTKTRSNQASLHWGTQWSCCHRSHMQGRTAGCRVLLLQGWDQSPTSSHYCSPSRNHNRRYACWVRFQRVHGQLEPRGCCRWWWQEWWRSWQLRSASCLRCGYLVAPGDKRML